MKTKIATAIVAAAILTGTAQAGDITTVDLKSELKQELQNVYVEATAGKINGKSDLMVTAGKWGVVELNTPYLDPFIYNFSVAFSANKQLDSSVSAMFKVDKDLSVYAGVGAESILADKTVIANNGGADNVGNNISYSTKETNIHNIYAEAGVVYNVISDISVKYGVAVGTDKTELTVGAIYMITDNDYVKVHVGKSLLDSGYRDPDLNVNVTLGYAF